MSDKIAEIRARHEEGSRAGVDVDRAYLLAEVERLLAEAERLRGLYEKGVVALVMIERMAAGGIYSQESIHATAVAAIKDLWGEGYGR